MDKNVKDMNKRMNHDQPFKVDYERSQEYTKMIKNKKTDNQVLPKTFV